VIIVKKHICLLLVICLLLSALLSGCGGDGKKILGTWTAEIDYAAAVNAGINHAAAENSGIDSQEDIEDLTEYIQFDTFPLLTTFTFYEDGTYTVTTDSISVFNAVHTIRNHMAAGMLEYVDDLLRKEDLSLSVNEFLGYLGLNKINLGEYLITDRALGEMAELLSKGTTGLYRVKNGKIYMTSGTDAILTEENYDTYTLDGNTLTLHECHCEQEEGFENINQELYPLVLTRVEE
jgi:hypothetical protein